MIRLLVQLPAMPPSMKAQYEYGFEMLPYVLVAVFVLGGIYFLISYFMERSRYTEVEQKSDITRLGL